MKIFRIFSSILVGLLIVFAFSCKKEAPKLPPTLSTSSVTNIASVSFSSGGTISDDGGTPVTSRGVCWNTSPTPTISNSKTIDGTGTGSFTSSITGLTPGTTYYLKSYAINLVGTSYGNEAQATTLAILSTISTTALSVITPISITSGGNISNDGGAFIIARGVCWSTKTNPTIADNKTTDGTGIGLFPSTLNGLNPGATYYIKAYATNNIGTSYGNELSTTTLAIIPSITTNIPTSITLNSATSGGNVTSDGGANVTSRGICWSTSANPTTADSKTTDGSGTGSFTSSITGLTASTTYYIRAYAVNSAGTAYGSSMSFTTSTPVPVLATVTTTSASAITETTAVSGGNVTSDGYTSVTSRGVCWGTSTNPTTANFKTTDGSGTGSFTSSLTGLTAGITYYVRSYVINSVGTAYGNQISFTTATPPVYLPTITTTAMSAIAINTATSGGNVTNDGGALIMSRGVCWSTSANPTTTNSKTADGIGAGSFTSSLTGLIASTTYYIRAYAINIAGTAYGTELTFTTNAAPVLPTVTTTAMSAIAINTATSGGNVTNDGSASVTTRGVCWSTSANPTTANSKTTDGSGTGSFTSSLTSLTAGTTYYVRSYAINSVGTAYGSSVSFTTLVPVVTLATVTTTAISSITSNSAIGGGNVTSDGNGFVTAKGVCWNISPNPTYNHYRTTELPGTGSFTSSLTNLTASTTYYVRSYAMNSAGIAYGSQITFNTSAPANETVTDIDGNTYATIKIGNQVWMAANLKTTRFRTGIPLLNKVQDSGWTAGATGLTEAAYCWYNNNQASSIGALYNFYAAADPNIAPVGWHIPTAAEFNELVTFLGGASVAGGKMKSTSSIWQAPNTGANNSSGFSALPAGDRSDNPTGAGTFVDFGTDAIFWTRDQTTVNTQLVGIIKYVSHNITSVGEDYVYKSYGFSIRCVKD